MGKQLPLGWIAGALLVAALAAQPATAQSAATGAGTSRSDALEEVLVTATKRTESVQDVPVSITAISARDLEAMGAQQFFDYGTAIPNLSFGIGASDGNLSGRGIALRGIEGSNATGFYIDDTPVLETLDPHVVDLARIEVLRGPKCTLYGAESMGGTVRLITEQPRFNLDGQVHVLGSGTDHRSFTQLAAGAVNVPIVPATLAPRARALHGVVPGERGPHFGRLLEERAAAAGEVALLSRRTRGLGFEFLKPARSGRVVVEADGLEVAIGGRVLLHDATFALERGEHVALVGPNGSGKTTLLETILGRREPRSGRVRLGHGVEVAYFSQQELELDTRGS